MAARWPEELPALMADKAAQLDNPKVVRLFRLLGRFLDEWEDDRLLQETADLVHELLQEAAETGQLDRQGEDDPAFTGLMDSFADQAHPRRRAAPGPGEPAGLDRLDPGREARDLVQVDGAPGDRLGARRPRCGRSRGPTWRPRRGFGRRAFA